MADQEDLRERAKARRQRPAPDSRPKPAKDEGASDAPTLTTPNDFYSYLAPTTTCPKQTKKGQSTSDAANSTGAHALPQQLSPASATGGRPGEPQGERLSPPPAPSTGNRPKARQRREANHDAAERGQNRTTTTYNAAMPKRRTREEMGGEENGRFLT